MKTIEELIKDKRFASEDGKETFYVTDNSLKS